MENTKMEKRHECTVNSRTYSISKDHIRSQGGLNSLRRFLCCRSFSLSSTPFLCMNFQTQSSDREEGRRVRMKAGGGRTPEGNWNIGNDEEEWAAVGKPVLRLGLSFTHIYVLANTCMHKHTSGSLKSVFICMPCWSSVTQRHLDESGGKCKVSALQASPE